MRRTIGLDPDNGAHLMRNPGGGERVLSLQTYFMMNATKQALILLTLSMCFAATSCSMLTSTIIIASPLFLEWQLIRWFHGGPIYGKGSIWEWNPNPTDPEFRTYSTGQACSVDPRPRTLPGGKMSQHQRELIINTCTPFDVFMSQYGSWPGSYIDDWYPHDALFSSVSSAIEDTAADYVAKALGAVSDYWSGMHWMWTNVDMQDAVYGAFFQRRLTTQQTPATLCALLPPVNMNPLSWLSNPATYHQELMTACESEYDAWIAGRYYISGVCLWHARRGNFIADPYRRYRIVQTWDFIAPYAQWIAMLWALLCGLCLFCVIRFHARARAYFNPGRRTVRPRFSVPRPTITLPPRGPLGEPYSGDHVAWVLANNPLVLAATSAAPAALVNRARPFYVPNGVVHADFIEFEGALSTRPVMCTVKDTVWKAEMLAELPKGAVYHYVPVESPMPKHCQYHSGNFTFIEVEGIFTLLSDLGRQSLSASVLRTIAARMATDMSDPATLYDRCRAFLQSNARSLDIDVDHQYQWTLLVVLLTNEYAAPLHTSVTRNLHAWGLVGRIVAYIGYQWSTFTISGLRPSREDWDFPDRSVPTYEVYTKQRYAAYANGRPEQRVPFQNHRPQADVSSNTRGLSGASPDGEQRAEFNGTTSAGASTPPESPDNTRQGPGATNPNAMGGDDPWTVPHPPNAGPARPEMGPDSGDEESDRGEDPPTSDAARAALDFARRGFEATAGYALDGASALLFTSPGGSFWFLMRDDESEYVLLDHGCLGCHLSTVAVARSRNRDQWYALLQLYGTSNARRLGCQSDATRATCEGAGRANRQPPPPPPPPSESEDDSEPEENTNREREGPSRGQQRRARAANTASGRKVPRSSRRGGRRDGRRDHTGPV